VISSWVQCECGQEMQTLESLDQLVLSLPLFCIGGNHDMDKHFQMLTEAGANLIHEYYSPILHKCVLDFAMNQVCILLNHGVAIARYKYEVMALHLAVDCWNWIDKNVITSC